MTYNETLPTRTREFIFKTKRTRNIDIIKGMGISKASFYNWINPRHRDYKKDFDSSIKRSKAELLDDLETEMMKQIEGYYITEEKHFYKNDRLVRKITHKKWIKGRYRHPSYPYRTSCFRRPVFGNARVLIYALKEARAREVY